MDEGETFGFLGPNGAGKSTTMKMLCTLVEPTAGLPRSRALTSWPSAPPRCVATSASCSEDPTLDEYLTAQENLRFHAELYGVPRRPSAALDAIGGQRGCGC